MDQKKVFNEFSGEIGSSYRDIANAEESRTFWNGITRVEQENNKDAKWLSHLKEKMVKLEQQNVVINERKVKKQSTKMANWRASGHDGIQGFWIKRPVEWDTRRYERNTILDNVRKNSAMSKGSSKGKRCVELQTNNLSSTYVEITYRYYFRGYVLFHCKWKLTSKGAKGLLEEK